MQRHPSIEPCESRLLFAAVMPAVGPALVRSIDALPIGVASGVVAAAVSPIEVRLTWQASGAAVSAARGAAGRTDSTAAAAPSVHSPASPTTTAGAIQIERALAGGSFVVIGQAAAGSTTYTDLGLSSNTTYQYRLRPAGSVATPAVAVSTPRYAAGLTGTFQNPTATTGRTLNILSYGATSNNSSNDDATAIRNAITDAVSGDEIYIPNGVFHIKARDIKLKSGVSIRGQSRDGAILSAVFNTQTDNPNSQVFRVEDGRSNVTFSNFRIEMSGGQSMQYGISLGSGSTGVSNTRRVAIRNVNIEGFERFAIAIRNCDNILVENCLLRNATALGGGGEGYGVMIGYPQTFNVWVKNNTIGPVIRHAVIIQYVAHNNLVELNTAIDNTEDAYDLHGEDEYANELRYNIAHGGDAFGFGIGNTGSTHDDSGPDNWIHHNEVYNSRGGVNIILGSDRQSIEDNYFHHNSEEGIKVYNGGGADLWFLRNRIQFNTRGVRLDDATNPLLIDNIITDNTGYGISVGATTTGYQILRNDLRNNNPAMILVSEEGEVGENQL